MMDARDAVLKAKSYVDDLFSNEGIEHLGLEEVDFDPEASQWRITLGFFRAWDRSKEVPVLSAMRAVRTFKVVILDEEGRPVSVRNLDTGEAG